MRKIFTFLTLIFFTTNTLVWGAPADAVSLLTGNSHAQAGLTIVHIQDAHSNYEAQKNIREILKNLHEKEGYEFVALEGAWQPLAPEVYHFFPNAKSNLKVADFLAQKGEMSGAELYALELAEKKSNKKIRFEGVENQKVYRENYELFKKGLAVQDEVKKYCGDLFSKLDLEKSRVYSPGFLRFDRNVRDYENKRLELSAFLRVIEKSTKEKLQIELISPDHQREWPYLCRMLRVMNALTGLDMEAVKKDAAKLGINLEDKTLAANPRAFFESIYADSVQKRISLDGYRALRQYSEYVILKSEITGPELFAEMDSLIEKLSDVYAVSPKEKDLLTRSRQTRLLEKLLKYEATGKEWHVIVRSAKHDEAIPTRSPRELRSLAMTAMRFYQLAESRNQILLDNTLTKMKSKGVRKAILITGGFHSDGIEAMAKQKNISYRTIQPQIQEEFSNQRYRDAILGSWRKEIAQSKIPKPLGMVKIPYDQSEQTEIVQFVNSEFLVKNISEPVLAQSLGIERANEKLTLVKRLHADLFNKTISIEKRRKIAEELIGLDHTASFQDTANARGRMLDEIVRSSTPDEASERLRQLSAVLCAEAEAEIRKTEELGYKRDPDAVLLGQAGYQVHLLATMMTDPVRYLEESENPNLIRAGQYLAIAGVFAVTILAFVNISQEIAKVIMGGLITGVFALFLGTVIYSIIRAVFPEKAKQAFDWENVFGPNDISIFNEFRHDFWHGDYDFSKINRIENVSLRLGLISEIANAHERGTLEDAEEVKRFIAFLIELKRSDVPRLADFADKLLEDKFQDNRKENKYPRLSEGASLGNPDPLEEFEKELKKKWDDFFYQTGRLGMDLAGEDFDKFRKLRKARLAFLYYALIDGRSYDNYFWDWNRLPAYFSELPVKYHTVRTVEWLNLVFPHFTPKEVHSEEAAQERTDFLQKALQEIENNYAEFLKFRFQGEDPINLIQQAVGNALPEIFLRVLEERGEDDVLNYIYQMRGYLRSTGAAKKSDGTIRVIKIPDLSEIKLERITLYEAHEIDLPWDPAIKKKSLFAAVWKWVRELIGSLWQRLSALSSSHQVLQRHHELFLDYLELLKNREAIGMPQIHFGTAWDMEIVHLLDLDQLIDGLKQNPAFVVKIINQTINTREVAHRTYPEEPGILKQKLLAGNASIEISKADPSKIKLYRRQIDELKDAIREEKKRQQQWQISKANSLGMETGRRPVIRDLTEAESHQLALEVFKKLGGTRLTREEAYWLNGQVINFETDQDFEPKDPILGISRLMRIGPLIFVLINRTFDEESIKAHIKAIKIRLGDTYSKSGGNIFVVNPSSDGTETKSIPIGPHTRSMIAAMLAYREKIAGAVTVDFGAGDGNLSRVALGLGARQAVLVEGNPDFKTVQKTYLESQGWNEKDFHILNMDMGSEDFKRTVQELNLPDCADVVLANIGPWSFYGGANETAIAYAAAWPKVGLFINGGYGFRGEHVHPYITRLLNLMGLNLNEGQFPGFRDVQKRLHKRFGFKTEEYIHWVSSEPRHNFAAGTIIAVKENVSAESLGKKKGGRRVNPDERAKMLGERDILELKSRVEDALGDMGEGVFAVGPFILVNVIKPGFIVNATTMLEIILLDLIDRFDGRLREKLGEVYDQNKRNIFFVNPSLFIRTASRELPISFYTISMLEQMIAYAKFFQGAQVIDFGAGDGLLSRLALALGARKVVLAEKEAMPANVAGIFLSEDGWPKAAGNRSGYEIRNGDLKTKVFGSDVKSESIRTNTNVVLANIGPWDETYGDVNRFVIERVSTWPAVSLILNGGYMYFKKFPLAQLPEEGKKHLKAVREMQSLLMTRGYETAMAGFLTAGTLVAIKAAKKRKVSGSSLGKKISERFRAPRFSDGMSKDKAWIIFNLVVYSPNFLEETNQKLKLGLGNRPIRDFYVERISSQNKDVYKIRIVVDGGSTAQFVLYAVETQKIWNAIVSGYEKGAEFNRLNPGFHLFPKVGAVRLNHKMHWVSAEYVNPYLKVSKKEQFWLVADAYFRLFKAGWTLTDLYFEQVMITRPGKKVQAKIIDLDYLRHLSTGEGHEEDLIEQVRKMFNSAKQFGGKDNLIETARIGIKYLPKEIILKGFNKFSGKLKGFKNIPSEDEMRSVVGMSLGSASARSDAEILEDLKKLFKSAIDKPEFVDLIDSIELEHLKYPKEGLVVSGDQFDVETLSSQNLYGVSIPVDPNGFSGDILETYIKDGALHIIVADAIGHDIASAFNRYLFQKLARRYPLQEVDTIFRDWHIKVRIEMRKLKNLREWPFLFFGLRYFELRMNLSDGSVSVRTATGVNDQLVEGPKGEMNPLHVMGPGASEHMIGMMTESTTPASFPWRELILKEGFLILLQTDGAYEARNINKPADERELGLKKIRSVVNQVISKNPRVSAREIIELIMTEVKSHLGDEPISDDITLVAFRVPKVNAASLGAIENELKKFEAEINGKKVTDVRLKEMVDWAERANRFQDLRRIFVKRLNAFENDFAARRGLSFLNAKEAGYHEFTGLIAPVSALDGGQAPVRALAVSPDARLFASANENGIVKVWDVETGQLRYRFEEKGYGIKSLQFSANSKQLEAGGTDFSSRVWFLNTGQKITHSASVVTGKKYITFDTRPISLKSSDSKRIIELDASGNVKVWDWNDRNHLQSKVLYEINGKSIFSIDISSDDRFFVTGGWDGRVIVWDFGTDQPFQRAFLGGNSTAAYSVKFSPDSNWVISGGGDGLVRLWAGHERKLKGFWQRFKLGFQLSDAEVKVVQDRIDFLGKRENYAERNVLEAYGENWQNDLVKLASVQGRKLAAEPNRDPKWKNNPVWLQDALIEFLHNTQRSISQKQRDSLIIIEDEMRHQLDISHPRPQDNTSWNDVQNILLVLDLLRASRPAIKIPNPEFPQSTGLSLGQTVVGTAEKFAGGIYPFSMYTSSLYPNKPKVIVVTGGFSVTVKTSDNFNLEAERKYLREHPRSVSVVLDRTGRIQEEDRLIVIPVKPGKEAEAIQSLLSGKDFSKIVKLARKLYEKPGVRLKQSAIHKRITIEASSSLLNRIGLTGAVHLLEIPNANELSALKVNSREFSAYALVHAALLGRAEGNLNDPLLKPFRANIERDPVTGIYRIVRNSLADRIAALETSLDVSRKILAAA